MACMKQITMFACLRLTYKVENFSKKLVGNQCWKKLMPALSWQACYLHWSISTEIRLRTETWSLRICCSCIQERIERTGMSRLQISVLQQNWKPLMVDFINSAARLDMQPQKCSKQKATTARQTCSVSDPYSTKCWLVNHSSMEQTSLWKIHFAFLNSTKPSGNINQRLHETLWTNFFKRTLQKESQLFKL